MKKVAVVSLAVIAMALLTTPAYSQSVMVRADIPFAFTANGVQMPAGMYTLRSDGDAILWRSSEGAHFTLGGTHAISKQSRNCLIFRAYGDHYVLSSIWEGTAGREFAQPKVERSIARGDKPKEVAILLYPVR